MGNTSRYSSRASDESSVAEEVKLKSMFTRTDANKSWTSRMETPTWSAMLLKFGGKSSSSSSNEPVVLVSMGVVISSSVLVVSMVLDSGSVVVGAVFDTGSVVVNAVFDSGSVVVDAVFGSKLVVIDVVSMMSEAETAVANVVADVVSLEAVSMRVDTVVGVSDVVMSFVVEGIS